jgi:regulatory protein
VSEPAPAPLDPALLEEWALAYLGRYASSSRNLELVLERRARRRLGAGLGADRDRLAVCRELIAALVGRLRASGLLDDAAYAAGRARSRLARGEPLRRIAAGLAAKGVSAAHTAAAVAGLREDSADPDLAAACAFARRRRLGPYRRDAAETADRQRELAAFARAGFDRHTASQVLACADEGAVAALLSG